MINNIQSGEKPKIERYKFSGTDMIRIPYDITETSPGIFTWREISVRPYNFNYGGIINELINLEYPSQDMTAIINNYLLDPEDIDIKDEFNNMQAYRKYAKQLAKEILEREDAKNA